MHVTILHNLIQTVMLNYLSLKCLLQTGKEADSHNRSLNWLQLKTESNKFALKLDSALPSENEERVDLKDIV